MFETFLGYFVLASPIQFLAECLIIVAGAVWTRDLLPSDEYDSVWGAMVYKLTYVSKYKIMILYFLSET